MNEKDPLCQLSDAVSSIIAKANMTSKQLTLAVPLGCYLQKQPAVLHRDAVIVLRLVTDVVRLLAAVLMAEGHQAIVVSPPHDAVSAPLSASLHQYIISQSANQSTNQSMNYTHTHTRPHAHTHTHTHVYGPLDFVQDYPGEPVPEK